MGKSFRCRREIKKKRRKTQDHPKMKGRLKGDYACQTIQPKSKHKTQEKKSKGKKLNTTTVGGGEEKKKNPLNRSVRI